MHPLIWVLLYFNVAVLGAMIATVFDTVVVGAA